MIPFIAGNFRGNVAPLKRKRGRPSKQASAGSSSDAFDDSTDDDFIPETKPGK